MVTKDSSPTFDQYPGQGGFSDRNADRDPDRDDLRRFRHSVLVRAMIKNNKMATCPDVSAIMQDCHASGAHKDQLCRTAAEYLNVCLETGSIHP